jgi:signal transduction histidine kinase
MPAAAWNESDPRFRPSPAVRLWGPVFVSLLIQVPVATAFSVWQHVPPLYAVVSVALAAASALALAGARRRPGPIVAIVAALTTAELFVPPDLGPVFVALAFAVIGAVARSARLWALLSVGAAWLVAVTASGVLGMPWHPFRIAVATLLLAASFAIGEAIRLRAERGLERRERVAERERTLEQEERTRIARELHDVLARSLSRISVESGVGLRQFDREPERAREALTKIRELSGTGLDEVRGVLAFLRGDDGGAPQTAPLTPQPQLADLPALVTQRTDLGLVVRLDDRLGAESPAGTTQTAAYRIVQEALAKIVRRSGASNAAVTLERADGAPDARRGAGASDSLLVRIEDDGSGGDPDAASAAGIRSMRERATLAGGTLDIHAGERSGTVVEARLPWDGLA